MATIIIRNSTGSGATPSSLVQGELAINTVDGKLFYGSGSGNIVKEFTGSGGASISASYALTASFAANGGVTQLLAGPNITLSPTDGKGQVTVSATLSGSTIFNTSTGSYGSFYDTTTQTNPVGNVPRSMSFDSTDITNGVSISGSTNPFNTYVKTTNAGVYNIQFSAQVDKTDSGNDEIVIWLRKNGIDLTDTATTLTLSGNNDKKVAAWNWFVTSAANDYYQIIWISADTNLRLLAEPISGTHPGIPSVILTANRVDQFLSNTGSFSGSFNGSFTGSLFGTASWATNALTASFINTASTNAFVQNGNSFGATALLGTNDNQSLAFETSGSTRMFISSSGNVGVGTITPNYGIHHVGTIGVAGIFSQRDFGFGAFSQISQRASFVAYTTDGSNGIGIGANGTAGLIQAFTGTIGSPSARILSLQNLGGNVSIGTTTDSARLTVRGSGATSATTTLRVENTNASASLIVLDNGAVGIGTAAPSASILLDVSGSARSTNFRLTDNSLIATQYTTGGTTLTVLNTGHNNAVGINVTSATGIRAASSLGVSNNNLTGASIYAAGGSQSPNISLGLLSNRALITSAASGMAMHTSSMLQIDSTIQGFLPPRTNLTSNIATPAQGLMTYLTGSTNEGLYYYNSGSQIGWHKILTNTGSQSITGSLIAPSITGSLQGTASWANNALTASYALSSPSTTVYVAHGNGTTAANSLSYTCYLGGTPVSITTATNAFGSAANQFMPGYPMAAAGTASGLIINLRTTGSAASAYKYYVSNFNTSTTGSVITMAAGHAAGVYSGSIGQVTFNQGDALFFMISSTFVAGASASAQLTTSTFKYTTN